MSETVFWFLIFGALFYFLMRKGGCGMHAHGGHGSHGGHGGPGGRGHHSSTGTVKDPVCGMTIDAGKASHTVEHQGSTYYFCSANCFSSFKSDPSRYVHGEGLSHH